MSVSATIAAVPREPAETRKLLLLIWAVTVATYLLTGPGVGPNMSTDDAMRLVQLRDLLAGQGWFDVTQYRLNPPEGVAMHWSRLIDVPIAILLRAAEMILPPMLAERLALTVWPAGLLLAFLFGAARLARDLADDAAARLTLMFAALMAPVLQHFRPGAIDHHNVQLVLMVWSLALLVRERPRDAACAGVLCALSLAIGQEMAPVIAALAALVALRWIIRGEPSRDTTAAFGIAFAAGALLSFIATVPPARYTVATCDALSIVQVLTAVCGGFGLAIVASWRGLATVRRRVVGAAALGEVLGTIVVLGFPMCLGDPYAELDPKLAALWLANVSEARSVASLMRDLPQEVLPYYGLPVIGLALGLYRSWRDSERWGWIVSTAALAIATLIALWQLRGSATANALALAIVAAAVVRGLPAPDGRAIFFGLGRAALVAALVLNPLALIAAGKAAAWAVEQASGARRPVVVSDGPGTCRLPSDYAPLAHLPKGLVLGFIDAGPLLLMETPHGVLAAPYHRNIKGNAAMFDVFLGRPEAASARLAALGVDYVAFCPGAPERHNYAAAAPDGLAAALTRGDVPDGLERIPLEGTALVVYRRH
jgi:hypothetical protein